MADLAKLATSSTSNGEELLALRLADLQFDVPSSGLIRSAERVMVDVVSALGVRVNKVLKHAHLRNVVQFLPGLGPSE